jgi:integrase
VNRQIVEPLQRLLRRAQSVWNVNCNPAAIAWRDLKMKEPEGRARELTTEEGEAFWAALRHDYLPFVLFLAQRGFRVRAALGMHKFDVDLARQTASVWRKGKGKIKMRLTTYHCALVRAEMKKCPSSPAVWTYEAQRGSDKGARRPITYSGLRRVIRKTLDEIGIADFHIHDLRHDFASKMLRNCRDLAAVQKAMAHSDIKSTLRYAHVLDDDVAAAMNMMPVPECRRRDAAQAKIRRLK